jgi:hypothetical protein
MIQAEFDATITLNDHHLSTSGLSGPEAVIAVRQAIERMNGAGWIDVAAWSYPPRHAWLGDPLPARASHGTGHARMAGTTATGRGDSDRGAGGCRCAILTWTALPQVHPELYVARGLGFPQPVGPPTNLQPRYNIAPTTQANEKRSARTGLVVLRKAGRQNSLAFGSRTASMSCCYKYSGGR